MIATIIISAITFIGVTLSILFFPRIKLGRFQIPTYWMIALLGAIVLLATNLAPIKEVFTELTNNSQVNPLKIIILFFSMTVLSIFLDEVGFFKYLAHLATKKAKNNQFILFTVFFALTAALTVFTSNDIVILTFTPFICMFCKNTKINPVPYLVAEFAAANTWSLMLLIGNPTNIYLATSAQIGFFDYFKVMAMPTLCAGIVEYGLLLLLFHRKLKEPLQIVDEEVQIESKSSLIIGLVHLVVCLIFLVVSNYINVEMWLVSLICASSLLIIITVMNLIRKKYWNYLTGSLKKLPYPLIPFFLSMFVIVVALNHQGIAANIRELLGNSYNIFTYGASSFVVSNLINNIPMSILFSNICPNNASVFAAIVGSNIGAILTPTGALAGIMFINLVNEHGAKYTFVEFIKNGVIVSIPVILTALGILALTVNFY